MAFPGSEKSIWRVVMRMISLWGSVFGIIAMAAGEPYPANDFFYFLMVRTAGFPLNTRLRVKRLTDC